MYSPSDPLPAAPLPRRSFRATSSSIEFTLDSLPVTHAISLPAHKGEVGEFARGAA